jgi:hypothetical protein
MYGGAGLRAHLWFSVFICGLFSSMQAAEATTARLTAHPLRLVLQAIGGPRQIAGKVRRLGRTLILYVDRAEIDRRLRTLEGKGYFTGRPTRLQILFGGLDMLRFVIEPASRDYYRQKGISFGFHQLLRVLDDPVSMLDPTGFLSERDTIVGHVMQVVHLNPVYDFERQVQAMVDGTHPRHATIGAIVEDPAYHARLLDYVRRFRADPTTPPPVRQEQTLRNDPHFAAAERTFATLPGFIGYCQTLPTGFVTLWRRLRSLQRFPLAAEVRSAHGDRP